MTQSQNSFFYNILEKYFKKNLNNINSSELFSPILPCSFYFDNPNKLNDAEIISISQYGAIINSHELSDLNDLTINITCNNINLSLKASILQDITPGQNFKAIKFKYKSVRERFVMRNIVKESRRHVKVIKQKQSIAA